MSNNLSYLHWSEKLIETHSEDLMEDMPEIKDLVLKKQTKDEIVMEVLVELHEDMLCRYYEAGLEPRFLIELQAYIINKTLKKG